MATHGSSHGLTFPVCSGSRPYLGVTMSYESGKGAGGRNNNRPLQGVHPRYIPKRGAVLKGIVRGVLRCFLIASPQGGGLVNSGDRRVRPAPAEAGGDGAEQGK